ncbi:MAG: hypothetical protein DMF96_29200 [Acidobacteria bacterium]|nr:MAG: hypothetical protein DMF96_29200 [Acidobacteriota bacterium]
MFLAPSSAFAQDTPQALRQEIDQLRKDFDSLKQQYGDRLSALEAKLAAAEGTPAAPAGAQPAPGQPPTAQVPAGAQGAGGPSGALPVYGAAGGSVGSSKVFNPDMAVIGDFLGASGRNTVSPAPALEMHESEAAFQAVVDPYARADFFVSFGEQGVNLEEGFLTFTELPGGLLTKVGKMRAAFGKVNTLHNHVLPWTDRPLVIQNLVGGEDGIDDVGFSVARLIPNPWIFLEATGQVLRGDSGETLFKSSERGDLSYVGHLRGYQDLSESTNIDLGLSYSGGHNASGVVDGLDAGRFRTNLYGVDATLRWKPLQRSIYHSFVGRTEAIWSRRDQFDGLQKAMGYYVSGDYQLGRRWFAGARYDRSDRADNASLLDSGQSLLLTYWPSEFSQVRGQYRRTKYAIGPTANELLFQFQFSIGAHGAHPF